MKYDDLYSGFYEDELELKMALQTTLNDDELINEAIK